MTKADLVTPVDLARRYTILQNALQPYKHAVSDILMVSSRTGGGLPKLRRVIQHVLQPTWRNNFAADETAGAAEGAEPSSSKISPRNARGRTGTSRPIIGVTPTTSDQPPRAGDRPIRAGDRPIRAGDRPIRAGDRPIRAGDRPIRAGDRPIRAGDRPIRAGDRPIRPTRAGVSPPRTRERAGRTARTGDRRDARPVSRGSRVSNSEKQRGPRHPKK